MADPQHPLDITIRHPFQQAEGGGGPSKSKILAVVTVFPVGGFLLLLSGMTLAGTLIGLALTFPLFVICSPVLVPAALTVALAVAGFLTSGAFGITALASLSWIINYLRKSGWPMGQMDYVKQRVQDTAGYMGQKTKEMGQMEHAKPRVQDTAGYMGQKTKEMGQKVQESTKT